MKKLAIALFLTVLVAAPAFADDSGTTPQQGTTTPQGQTTQQGSTTQQGTTQQGSSGQAQ